MPDIVLVILLVASLIHFSLFIVKNKPLNILDYNLLGRFGFFLLFTLMTLERFFKMPVTIIIIFGIINIIIFLFAFLLSYSSRRNNS